MSRSSRTGKWTQGSLVHGCFEPQGLLIFPCQIFCDIKHSLYTPQFQYLSDMINEFKKDSYYAIGLVIMSS